MSVSVETTNAASKAILQTAVAAGFNALLAVAIKSPIGALGGAIYGATSGVVSSALVQAGNKFLNLEDPALSAAAKTVAAVISFFASNAAAWALLTAIGWKITFAHVIVLSLSGLAAAMAVGIIAGCGVLAVAAVVSPRHHAPRPML